MTLHDYALIIAMCAEAISAAQAQPNVIIKEADTSDLVAYILNLKD